MGNYQNTAYTQSAIDHFSLPILQPSTTVSVIIPAYNAGHFIEDAIASVLAQDLRANEIIVVNDGSTDRDYSGLEDLHHSVKVINQPNRGVSAARNLGCATATGTYIAILDADDVWLQGKLRAQVQHLSRAHSVAAVFCRGLIWTPAAGETRWVPPPISITSDLSDPRALRLAYSDFLCSIPVAPSSMVVKRSVWLELGGFKEDLRYGEDHDFYLRLSHQYLVDLLDAPGMLYRQHPNSATAVLQVKNHLADVLRRTAQTLGTTDKFGNRVDMHKLASHLASIHFQHGYEHFSRGRYDVARLEFWSAVTTATCGFRTWAYFALCCTPGVRALARRVRQLLPQRENPGANDQSV